MTSVARCVQYDIIFDVNDHLDIGAILGYFSRVPAMGAIGTAVNVSLALLCTHIFSLTHINCSVF